MTAREEDILTSQNLIKKGVVLDKLLEALIVSPNVKLDDILTGDKNAIFIAARILAYGKDYKIKFKDPSNGEDVEDTVDLTKLENKDFDFEAYDRGQNLFEYELPYSKRKIHWSMLTHADERTIDQELKSMKKFSRDKNQSSEVTTRLKYVIKALDGNEDKGAIKKFVDTELLARDSLAFRNYVKENTPDIDLTFNFESEDTGYTERMNLPLGVDFFTLPPEYKVSLHEEIFNLSYYSQGAFSQDIVYNLPIYLRRFYARKLVDVKNKENEQIKKARQDAKTKSASKPSMPSKRSYK